VSLLSLALIACTRRATHARRSYDDLSVSKSDEHCGAKTDAAVLAGLPDELRRAYRDGDFGTGLKGHHYQVIPTGWIEAAQKRWKNTPPRVSMTAIGLAWLRAVMITPWRPKKGRLVCAPRTPILGRSSDEH